MKLKINDTIKVISGDDKGRTGKIIKVLPSQNLILVDGLNTYKKHLKNRDGQQGGIVTLSRPLQVSKVMLLCPNCQKTTRLSFSGTGKDKVRVCTHCHKPITTEIKSKKSKK